MNHYDDSTRGTFQNEEYAKQLVSFEGMRYEGRQEKMNVSPTDIDGFIQLDKSNCFIFFELKKQGRPSMGQGSALMKLVDAVEKSGANSVLFVACHGTSEKIVAKDARLTEVYWNHEWHEMFHSATLGEAIERFIKRAEAKERNNDKTRTGSTQEGRHRLQDAEHR